jgi:transcriptional regulator with XRE-family HTH domain
VNSTRKSRLWLAVERDFGKPMRDVLTDLLLDKRMTQPQVARRLGVSQGTVSLWWTAVQAEPQPEVAA